MKSKSPLIMLEQLMMLLVFALAAAICVRAFVRADRMSETQYAADRAVMLCRSAAELYKAETGDYRELVYRLTGDGTEGEYTETEALVYYDENWDPVATEEQSEYVLIIEEKEPKINVRCAEVRVLSVKEDTLLYGVPVSRQEVACE